MNPALPGELMMIGFEGTRVTPALAEWITKRHVGGVILFSRNLGPMGQVSQLITRLQNLRAKVSPQPLFVAIDQEGGVVSRAVPGMTVLPGNMALGAIGLEDSAFAAGRITGEEMGTLGFNVNLAPVLDLSCDPANLIVGVRSFGENPALVGKLGAAMIQGMQQHGVLAAAKHFPGLGRCVVDPHQDLPVVLCEEEALLKGGLAPFADAIAAGVQILMTSHAVYRFWDAAGFVPATLSHRILQNILRDQLGFRGMVLSDDLEMRALTKYFSPVEIARGCVQAGVDMLTVCHSHERQMQTFTALQEIWVQGGEYSQRMKNSLQRIEQAKGFFAQSHAAPSMDLHRLGIHRELATRMGRDSVTLIRDDAGRIPLQLKGNPKVLVLQPRYQNGLPRTEVEEAPRKAIPEEPLLLELLRAVHGNIQLRFIDLSPSPKDFDLILSCRAFDLVILLTYNAHLFPRQMEHARKLLAQKKEVVVVALRNPYDVAQMPQAQTVLATYGFQDCSMRALAGVLSGEIVPKGTMPVHLEKS